MSALRTRLASLLVAAAAFLAAVSPARAVDIPADLQIDLSSLVVSKEELVCLALNDYWEARSESLAGRIAVARVVLNRAMDPRFPSNLCDVVKQVSFQGDQKKCQFSWYCEGKSETPYEPDQWRISLQVAAAVLQADCAIPDPTGGALWYHADFTRPAWAVGYESTTIIGNHVFYRDPDGQRGKAPAPRKPFIYRLNAFAESVANKAKSHTYASAGTNTASNAMTGLSQVSAVAVKDNAAAPQPLPR
jgi:hypothetical protein